MADEVKVTLLDEKKEKSWTSLEVEWTIQPGPYESIKVRRSAGVTLNVPEGATNEELKAMLESERASLAAKLLIEVRADAVEQVLAFAEAKAEIAKTLGEASLNQAAVERAVESAPARPPTGLTRPVSQLAKPVPAAQPAPSAAPAMKGGMMVRKFPVKAGERAATEYPYLIGPLVSVRYDAKEQSYRFYNADSLDASKPDYARAHVIEIGLIKQDGNMTKAWENMGGLIERLYEPDGVVGLDGERRIDTQPIKPLYAQMVLWTGKSTSKGNPVELVNSLLTGKQLEEQPQMEPDDFDDRPF